MNNEPRRRRTDERHSESRMRENRLYGSMRGRSPTVIGTSLSLRRLRPTLLRTVE
jgi:hypothetical protein